MKPALFLLSAHLLAAGGDLTAQEWAPARLPVRECARKGAAGLLPRPAGTTAAGAASAGSNTIDVATYALNLRITPPLLAGTVTVRARVVADTLSGFVLDLSPPMTVDSVTVNGTTIPPVRFPASLAIRLDRVYGRGEIVSCVIAYHGSPDPTGLGSFAFSSNRGLPWVWTLSEPYGARDWWPCKDHPLDKADSVDITVTCASPLKVGSNGRLLSVVNNGDGTRTHRWQESYPIATYLVSLTLADFAEFSHWYRYSPTDSMQILNYVLPQSLAVAEPALFKTVEMLRIFSGLFGEYPFLREKYGHTEFGWGGAMEHQTMTSTTTFEAGVIAHELAHQWFGDLITCATWRDLWLNEGFATYAEALYAEALGGRVAYHLAMSFELGPAKNAAGTLSVQDTADVRNLFAGSRVYSKGAAVLHMLRKVLGDATFFHSLRSYVADPRFRYGTATTRDFQRVCEAASGRPLGWFFDQWIYGEQYPVYRPTWSATRDSLGATVTLQLRQTTRTQNPAFFQMPVDCRFSGAGRDTTVTVMHTFDGESFLFHLPFLPAAMALDPESWILRDVDPGGPAIPESPRLLPNYPNPFNAGTTIEYALPVRGEARLAVFSLLGEEIATLFDGVGEPGTHTVFWNGRRGDGTALPTGAYFLRLGAGSAFVTRRILLLR